MNETATPNFDLESELRGLTTWEGPAPNLWKSALAAGRRGGAGRTGGRWRRVTGWAVGGIAAILAIGAVGVWTLSPSHTQGALRGDFLGGVCDRVALSPLNTEQRSLFLLAVDRDGVPEYQCPSSAEPVAGIQVGQELSHGSADDLARLVVRKATIEIVTKDVRAAFLKAAHLISAAQGEFVQESSLTGTEPHLQGSLVLRVAVPRLSEVLNELRQLGTVRAETSSGEDVTTQVVDLEARLRNEQRVEAELLQLLDKRQDAPLKEIVELHSQLSQVRQTIEQYVAQQERLSRLVSLATVLVIIRADDAPPPAQGLGTYFFRSLADAWYAAVRLLVDTLAVLVRLLLGGAVWWLILLAIVLAVRAHLRHRRRSV